MARCVTVTIYNKDINPDEDIWVTQYLTDKLFSCGFRIINPEYNATPDRIKADTEELMEICEQIDSTDDEFVGWSKPRFVRLSQDVNRRSN